LASGMEARLFPIHFAEGRELKDNSS